MTCREKILSNDYADLITDYVVAEELSGTSPIDFCFHGIDDGYGVANVRRSMFGTPTERATVEADAPGYMALTTTVGGVISGNCATGRVCMVSNPASTIKTASTVAKIGLFIKNLENMTAYIILALVIFYFTPAFEVTGFTLIPSRTLSIADVT